MSKEPKAIYQFDRFRLDASQGTLCVGERLIPLQPKLFDTLLALVESRGRIVGKEELMNRVWPDSFVEENNLNKNISLLRKLLGEDRPGEVFIETIPKRGYRFVATVEEISDAGDELLVATRTHMRIVMEEDDGEPGPSAEVVAAIPPEVETAKPAAVAPLVERSRPLRVKPILGLSALAGLLWVAYHFWPTPPPTHPEIKSIAVLPFKPLVARDHDESIELGMSETLINRLSSIRDITVRPMSAVRKYSALDQDPLMAGREQNVDGVLDGTIQRTAGRLRVTARFVATRDGRTVWAEKFDQRVTDIFTLQDSISEKIAVLMAVKLTGQEKTRLTRHDTNSPEAYQFYLRGRVFLNQGTEDGMRMALETFDRAIALDPGYALAYVGKANVYATYSSQYFVPSEAMPKAKLELQEALRLDSQLPEAHHSMARIHQWFDWDRKSAEEEFRKALELQPNSTETLISYFGFLSQERRFDECFAQLKRAQQLDPLSVHILYNFGYLFTLMGEYDKAIEQFQRALALSPNYDPALRGLCAAYREKGRYGEAIASVRRAVDLNDFDNYLAELGYTYAVAGQRDEALNQLTLLLERSKRRYVSPVRIARVYAGLGMKMETYEWLDKAYQDHSDHILNLAVDPMFAGLRGEPPFEALLRKIGIGR